MTISPDNRPAAEAPAQVFPNRERVRLTNYTGRFQPSQGPGPMIVMGLVFVGAGVGLLGGMLGWYDLKRNPHIPDFVLWLLPAIFGAPGLMVFAGGLRVFMKASRARRVSRERPGEPWLADHPWNPAGSLDDTPRRTLAAWTAFLFFAVFMAPFHWWAFLSGGGPWLVAAVCVLFDLIIGFMGLLAINWTARWIRYGRSRLVHDSFPYYLGEPMRATLRNSRPIAGAELVVRLRCVEPVMEIAPSRSRRSNESRTVFYQVYLDERRFPIDRRDRFRGVDAEIEFPLPDERLSTQIARAPIRYWELEATCETPGVDFSSSFALPVYGREQR